MADQKETQEAEAAQVVEPQAEQKAEEQVIEKRTPEEVQAELEKVRAALKAANAEAAQRRKKLDAYEAEEQKRKEAEMSEIDLLKQKVAESEAVANQLKLESHQRAAAEKVGLPSVFANRIQGETLEDMEADAKALFDALPVKPVVKPVVGITNPGLTGMNSGETAEQRNKRLGLA